ncbi:hypothetical protein BRADI_3g54574v3 [Brachypodium distachyon]|uniref:Uncharacterized protein n=1 Tax=Brachypodium distachyon TaxID=15368 RepID=A0A0Q3FPY2_BRADI|nr:hypothetical protein BRADI_3g54574v3 [Brachypodium distachyon]
MGRSHVLESDMLVVAALSMTQKTWRMMERQSRQEEAKQLIALSSTHRYFVTARKVVLHRNQSNFGSVTFVLSSTVFVQDIFIHPSR